MSTAATGGARVAQLRKVRDVTQVALARRAGISVRLLSKIEMGTGNPIGWSAGSSTRRPLTSPDTAGIRRSACYHAPCIMRHEVDGVGEDMRHDAKREQREQGG